MRKLTFALAAIAAALTASPAFALLPPQAYANARANAANVIIINVEAVEFTSAMSCTVRGTVGAVERGAKYEGGAAVELTVPCRGHVMSPVMTGAVIFQNSQALQASTRGRAYLDDAGALALYQYEILAAE
ncbi:hypothetical protein [Terricaulis sp.]|uniref:hypothetical protein n=1 Tax=Terricaulis sp. TaxID=2768686 RepID=UPI002AC4F909|nr:hypothetical protein [Terricaulis sp.]MDZ4690717.1 hypothetical protein [Terricaulis sp.]